MLPTKRKELCDYLNKEFVKLIKETKKQQGIAKKLEDKYGIELSHSTQVLSMSTNIIDESDALLFCVLSVINQKLIEDYFTEVEIKKYSNINFAPKINHNIKIRCIQIQPDQWIGKMEVSEILALSDNNMLHYEENTQRVMQKKVVDGFEYYTATVNEKAVNQIMESMRNHMYIPNTITLNVPIDQAVPYYDDDNVTLYIDNINYLDIVDGYHRFIAMNRLYRTGFEFTIPMEVRIVNFETDKARMFIFQEDQKTKMKKIDSNSFNVAAPQNKVVDLLKNSGTFRDVFERNGAIDSILLATFLKELFVKVKKEDQLKVAVQFKNRISNKLTEIMSINPEILDTKWDTDFILAFVYGVDKDLPLDEIENVYATIKGMKKQPRFYQRGMYYLTKQLER